jgi:hypothetical protein
LIPGQLQYTGTIRDFASGNLDPGVISFPASMRSLSFNMV